MSSPPAPPDAGDPALQPIFPDEILSEIFLRLDAAADLARASAACTAFLRVVRFLRRNRSLYRQPVVGFLECERHTFLLPRSFYHAQPPHRSASAARDLAEAADFTCWWATPYSAATGQWGRVTFDGWKMNRSITPTIVRTSCRYHPKISLYNSSRLFSEVLMLDTHKMEFSMVCTPLVRHSEQNAIIEAGEGRLGFLNIVNDMLDLYCKGCQDNGVSAEEWQHEKTIPIPLPDYDGYSISFCGTGDGYLLIQAIPLDSAELMQMPEIHYFTLHVKTLLVERLCMLNKISMLFFIQTSYHRCRCQVYEMQNATRTSSGRLATSGLASVYDMSSPDVYFCCCAPSALLLHAVCWSYWSGF